MTYYKQKPTSELPTKTGFYNTDLGLTSFGRMIDPKNSVWMIKHERVTPLFWLEPIELLQMTHPVDVFHDYSESVPDMNAAEMIVGRTVMDKEQFISAAKTLLSSNTAKLQEDIEHNVNRALEIAKERDKYFEQIKILTEALEKIRDNEAVGGYSYNHMIMKATAREALSTINK